MHADLARSPSPRPALLDEPERPLFLLRADGRATVSRKAARLATKRDQAGWVYLPEWLIEAIEDTCPLEDRTRIGVSSR